MNEIVSVKGLRKEFKVHYRKSEGLLAAVKTLYRRDYDTVVAVDGIDLSIRRGDIHALIGPNGSGKSTTIKMLSGILYPTAGEVRVLGYTPWNDRVKFVSTIGVLFGQKSQLNWDLPALDTFALQREIYKIPQKDYREMLDYMVSGFGIEQLIQKPVRNLSLGERMKCELVCILLHSPELVFLDEPTLGLDVNSKESVRMFVRKLNQDKGTTFILTTHDLAEVESLCSRVTVINHGSIVYDDTLDNLRGYYAGKKVLTVQLTGHAGESMLSDAKFSRLGPLSAMREVDTDKEDLKAILADCFLRLPVKDLEIQSATIEDVIKEIYQKTKENVLVIP